MLARVQRLRKHYRDQVVTTPRELRSLERLIVNELERMAIRINFLKLKES